MKLSKQSAEILLDLVEIKISAMQIHDREDARELLRLKQCREELLPSLQNKRKSTGRKVAKATGRKKMLTNTKGYAESAL